MSKGGHVGVFLKYRVDDPPLHADPFSVNNANGQDISLETFTDEFADHFIRFAR